MTVIAVLPAYNEAEDLPLLLERYVELVPVLEQPLRVIVVDDASCDDTAGRVEAFNGLDLRLIRHAENRGLGGALWTGLCAAASEAEPDDVIITMDADDTHHPLYIPDIVRAIRERGLDVVVASRYAPGGKEHGVSFLRRLCSHSAALLYRLSYGLPNLTDYSCGYRGFRARVLQRALAELGHGFIRESGFAATGEIILNLRHFTDRYGEVPFELHYEWKHGKSKMRVVNVALHTLRLLWRLRRRPQPEAGCGSPSRAPRPLD